MISPEATQRIIDAYAAGVSINGIAATFRHQKPTVRRALRKAGVVLRDDAAKPKISKADLIRRHQDGWTPRQIADSCGAEIRTIHQRLAELGLPIAARVPRLPAVEILAAHSGGESRRSIAARYGVNRETISRILATHGVGPEADAPVISPLKLADLCRRGLTVTEMSAATGVGPKALRKHLAAAGMQAADKRPGRERPAHVPEKYRRAAR